MIKKEEKMLLTNKLKKLKKKDFQKGLEFIRNKYYKINTKGKSWPKKVNIISGDEICFGSYHDGNKSCLIGHVETNFIENKETRNLFREIIFDFAKSIKILDSDYLDYNLINITVFNDSMENQPEIIAEIWNIAMEKLGYTEICDR